MQAPPINHIEDNERRMATEIKSKVEEQLEQKQVELAQLTESNT